LIPTRHSIGSGSSMYITKIVAALTLVPVPEEHLAGLNIPQELFLLLSSEVRLLIQ
jgi:hypothetical protein